MANTQATKEAMWMTKFMKELRYIKKNKEMVILYDNQGAISLTKIPPNMLKQSTLMCNITLLKNELKMAKLHLNIVQQRTWWWMSLLNTLSKERHNNLITMFKSETS
jgi:hypothetical protein